jgi:hypothetical protein
MFRNRLPQPTTIMREDMEVQSWNAIWLELLRLPEPGYRCQGSEFLAKNNFMIYLHSVVISNDAIRPVGGLPFCKRGEAGW